MNDANTVPEPISQLIEVFEASLADVEFPGVTAASLRAQATEVDAAAHTLAEAEATVRSARAAHAELFGALRDAAERGLGYARVYASGDEELSATLGGIEVKPPKPRRMPPKKRGRKPKAQPDNVAELPLQAETA